MGYLSARESTESVLEGIGGSCKGFPLGKDRAALTKQVKEANDIVSVIGGYLPLKSAGTDVYKCLCPFHNDHRPSMQVSSKYQNYRCWSCGKTGDVFTFVQDYERISFLEARALLARRANIMLEAADANDMTRVRQLEALRWAADQYHQLLLDSPLAEQARAYLGERRLLGDTVRRFGIGFAPIGGEWLLQRLDQSGVPLEVFIDVGLIGHSKSGSGYYDRFRDRVMFPIRNAQGQVVGFGGRVLPNSPLAERGPKYYNSAETPIFSKSDLLYGLDLARHAAASAGYLAVVEGYTDVMMAHQHGVNNVVATMGTALNHRHVQQVRRYVSRVVLVFDADEGGETGVDRALEIFAGHNLDLAIARLPEGLDPCDLLVQQGPDPLKQALTDAIPALDFKLNQLLEREAGHGVEGQRRVIDEVLRIVAQPVDGPGNSIQIKRELMVTRIAQRLSVRQETIWARLEELKRDRPKPEAHAIVPESADAPKSAPAPVHEKQLLQLLLAHSALVPQAMGKIALDDITHLGLRKLLDALYSLQQEGQCPDFDGLRLRLEGGPLIDKAMELMEIGRHMTTDVPVWLEKIAAVFDGLRSREEKLRIADELMSASNYETEIELLRRKQNHAVGTSR